MSKDKSGNWFSRHKVLTGVGVLILLIAIGSSASGNGSSSKSAAATTSTTAAPSDPSPKPTSPPADSTPKLNQPANDGKFQFTITSFKCGDTQITQPDSSYITSQAQGQFCIMNLSIKNIGSVAQTLDDASQYIYDASNKQYSDSTDGTIVANPSGSQFASYESVNPGVTVSGVIVFDVPKGVVPTHAMLHDSGVSNGVKVSLQ